MGEKDNKEPLANINFDVHTCGTYIVYVNDIGEWMMVAYECKDNGDIHISKRIGDKKTAQWLINSDGYYPYCSNCKNEPPSGKMTDYCPCCGKYMKVNKNNYINIRKEK